MKKKIILVVLLAIAGVAAWYFFVTRKKPKDETPDRPPVTIKSSEFRTVDSLLASYYDLTEAFVKWDTPGITSSAKKLSDRFKAVELYPADSQIKKTAERYLQNMKVVVDLGIIKKKNIDQQRYAFLEASQQLHEFLREVKYDNGQVYLQECPMAFNDTGTGIWLSKTPDIRNPYLGLYHPRYGKGMLACGETKGSITSKTQ